MTLPNLSSYMEAIKDTTKQVPALVVLVILVFILVSSFEKHQSKLDLIMNHVLTSLDKNTKVLDRNIEMIGELKYALKGLK